MFCLKICSINLFLKFNHDFLIKILLSKINTSFKALKCGSTAN